MIFFNNSNGSKDQHCPFSGDNSRRQLLRVTDLVREVMFVAIVQGSLRGDRGSPKVNKYWRALHEDDSSRKCSSETCQDLRKMTDVTRRIQLMKDNGDSLHCCGDHRSVDCRKQDRVCSNGS